MRGADLVGSCGRAWLLKPEKPNPSTLCSWLVNRPGAHPCWEWWLVGLITLKDIPGIRPARKSCPESEYELMIYAIDPGTCSSPEPDDPNGYPPLLPLDVVEQFHGISEVDAKHLTELVVQTIVSGRISPDQDFRRTWGDVIAGTVQHLREGQHALN
jgi:hypothetical protein